MADDNAVYDFLADLAEQHKAEDLQASATPGSGGTGDGYRGGAVNRSMQDWLPRPFSADAAINADWFYLLTRGRDLVRNDSHAAKAVTKLTGEVVGGGIGTSATVREADSDELSDDFNDESDGEFMRWAENEADATGTQSLFEMQETAFRETCESGEVLWLECMRSERGRTVPLCYQLVEPEQLDTTRDREASRGRNRISRGIEFDAFGRPTAYYLFDVHPYGLEISGRGERSRRIPARRIIHNFRKLRPSQSRGVTWFAPILQTLRDLDRYLVAELQSARVGAFFAVAIKREQGAGSGLGIKAGHRTTTDSAGNPLIDIGTGGAVADLGPNDSVEQIARNIGRDGAEAWLSFILQSIANGLGISYSGLTSDYKGINFSSATAARNDDRRLYDSLQRWFGRQAVSPIRRRWTAVAAANEVFDTVSGGRVNANLSRYLEHDLELPGRDPLDSIREVTGIERGLKNRITTFKSAIARSGHDYRKVFRQLAREFALLEELGLTPEHVVGMARGPRVSGEPSTSAGGNDRPGRPRAEAPTVDRELVEV